MSRKRKILFLIPSLRGGGAERTLINLLHKVDYNRYDIDLIVVSKLGPYIHEVPEEVEVTYLFRNNFLVRVLGYLHRTFNIEWFFRKKMAVVDKSYDVGISFLDSNYTDLLFFTDSIEKRVSFIHGSYLSHSNYDRFYKHDYYRNKMQEKRFSKLDGIYFVSHDSMSDFVELFGEFPEMGVVYNMIDREGVLRKSRSSGTPTDDTFTFMAAGSLIPIKGFDRLIRAAGIARNKGYNFKVLIAGSGPEEKSLNQLIHNLKLEETIKLLGFVKNPYPLMKSSDVFVMSSVSEALPTVLCEAMILGVPTLVTNCSGCRGLVEGGEYGLMAEQDDHDYADKMMLLMDDSRLLEEYAEKSLQRAVLFDDERILQRYYEIFDSTKVH
jgi:glycosyltransferase involved in cell wall biosynthesis